MIPGILSVCGDPGGASVIAPVLQALRQTERFCIHSFAYRQGTDRLRSSRIEVTELSEGLGEDECVAFLKKSDVNLLLVGTSMNGIDLELRFLSAARRIGIPSLAVLDYWSNYRGRFGSGGGPMILPDRIAIMDEQAFSEMVAEGFPPEILVVTGQPAFDALATERNADPQPERERWREAFGVRNEDLLAVFVSQPITEMCQLRGESPDALGFTEMTVLAQLLAALEALSGERDRSLVLVIRPHPRESSAKFDALRSARVRVVVSSEGPLHAAVKAADLVIGMNSVALVEACYLGVAALSLQPGLRESDTVPTNRAGLSVPVYEAAGIQPALEELLFDSSRCAAHRAKLRDFAPDGRATSRVVQLVEDLLAHAPSPALPFATSTPFPNSPHHA